MSIYKLRPRKIRFRPGFDTKFQNIKFPSEFKAKINCIALPGEPFGGNRNNPFIPIISGKHGKEFIFNANFGTVHYGGTLFEKINMNINLFDNNIELNGNEISVDTICKSLEDFHNLIFNMLNVLPMYLSFAFNLPINIETVRGSLIGNILLNGIIVNEMPFTIEYYEASGRFEVSSKENQENKINKMVEVLSGIPVDYIDRIFRSVLYYHQALCCKLSTGDSFDYFSERILNLTKIIETLFGGEKETIKEKMKIFDYDDDFIEQKIIMLIDIRNYMDIGHAVVEGIEYEELKVIEIYIDEVEEDIRKMILKVMEYCKTNQCEFLKYKPKSLKERKKYIDKIKRFMSEKIKDNPRIKSN